MAWKSLELACRIALLGVVLHTPAGIAASALQPNCDVHVDALTLRMGTAVLPYLPPQQDASGSAVRLASRGRSSLAGREFTIWSLTNAGVKSADVVLQEGRTLNAVALRLPARTETLVRSDGADASHTLWQGLRHVDSRRPSTVLWTDERPVADPLCSEPVTGLWVARRTGLYRVSSIDGRVLIDIPRAEGVQLVSVAARSGNAWAWSSGRLHAYDPRGINLLDVSTIAETVPVDPSTRHLAIDEQGGNVWLTLGSRLYRLGFDGSVLGEAVLAGAAWDLELDTSRSRVWVATHAGLTIARAGSNTEQPLINSVQTDVAGGAFALALDAAGDSAWISTRDGLAQYGSDGGRIRAVAHTERSKTLTFLAADGRGGLWGSDGWKLFHLGGTGVLHWGTLIPPDSLLGWEGIVDLVPAHDSGTVWLVSRKALYQYGPSASSSHLFGPLPLNHIQPLSAGLTDAAGRTLRGGALFVDSAPPMLEITAPAEGAIVNDPFAAIELSYVDEAGDAALDSLELIANGTPLSTACVPLGAATARCVGDQALPEGHVHLVAKIADGSGNRSLPAERSFLVDTTPPPAPDLRLSIIEPALTGSTADGSVLVRGRVLGATQAGVTIAGRAVGTTGEGSSIAFAGRVELEPGMNTLEIVARDQTGRSVNAVLQVTRVDSTPFVVVPSTTRGIAPVTVAFEVRRLGAQTPARIDLDLDGDGDIEISVSEPRAAVQAQFTASGSHVAIAHVFDDAGQRFSYRIPVVVETRSEVDAQLRVIWSNLTTALASGDTPQALRFFLPESAARYSNVLEMLRARLPQITSSLSSPATVSLDSCFAEVAVTRQLQGEPHVFLIDFVRDSTGLWRVAQM